MKPYFLNKPAQTTLFFSLPKDGLNQSLKDMLKIVSIKISSYLHFNVLQSLNSWRNVFWLAASITMAGAITFAVLASDQLQDWAEEKKCDQGGKIERA